jgi:hypothetical protein
MNEDLCTICGEPATRYFGRNKHLPVCENVVCQQAVIELVNGELQVAQYERWDEVEVVDV